MKLFANGLFGFGALLTISQTWAQPPLLYEWNSVLSRDHLDEIDKGRLISETIFDGIDRIRLVRFDLDRLRIDVSVERKVYRNPGTDGTWSVVDHFYLNSKIPFIRSGRFGIDSFGFHAGVESRLGMLNIRQIKPEQYSSIPSTDQQVQEIRSSEWWKLRNPEASAVSQNSLDHHLLSVEQEDGSRREFFCPFPPDDIENRAKFCNFLDRIVFPFRLPLRAEDVSKLDDGELISYLGTGALEFGPSVGFDWSPVDFVDVGIDARFSFFLRGSFQVNVFKENERFVQLSAGRATGFGWASSLNSGIDTELFEGVFLLGKIDRVLRIIPFQMRLGTEFNNGVKVTYRYDLHNPHARQAYEEAVAGRLALSDYLSIDEEGHLVDREISGVEKLETREERRKTDESYRRTQLGFVFKKNLFNRVHDIEAKITTAEGVENRFETIASNSREARVLLRWYEKLKYFFTVAITQKESENGLENRDVYEFSVAAQIDDSHTQRDELLSYIYEAEDTVGKVDAFPRPPSRDFLFSQSHQSRRSDHVLLPKNHFGVSRFDYRIDFNESQIMQMKNYVNDDDQVWEALEYAFQVPKGSWGSATSRFWFKVKHGPWSVLNVPLYLLDVNLREGSVLNAAEKVRAEWKKVVTSQTPKEFISHFGRMFYTSYYSYELVRLLRYVLDGERVEYRMAGYSPLFGQINTRGESTLSFENVSSGRSDARPSPEDPAFKIRDFNFDLDGEEFELTFTLPRPAEAVFLQLMREVPNWWVFAKGDTHELILYSSDSYHLNAGLNKIRFNRSDKNDLFYDIANKIDKGKKYKFQISMTPDSLIWGHPTPLVYRAQ